MEIFKENVSYFRRKWVNFPENTNGYKIKGEKIIEFFITLADLLCKIINYKLFYEINKKFYKLGFDKMLKKTDLAKIIMNMEIKWYNFSLKFLY